MDDVKKYAAQAADAAEKGLDDASKALRSSLAWVAGTASQGLEKGQGIVDVGQAHLSATCDSLAEHRERAFGALKSGVEYILVRPELAYPIGAVAAVAALPPLRRLLYRATIGRLQSPEAVLASAEQRLGALGARADEYGLEVTKLQSRAAAAHEEMTRGASKLKAARAELQRLQAAVARSERAAAGVLDDVRALPRAAGAAAKATELRAEAAQKLAAARQQHATLRKELKWIARLDV